MSRTKKAPTKRTKKAPATRQPRKPAKQLHYVIVRAEQDALLAGEEVYVSTTERFVVLRNSRRIWNTCRRHDEISLHGVEPSADVDAGPTICDDVVVFGVLEILPASDACRDTLIALPE